MKTYLKIIFIVANIIFIGLGVPLFVSGHLKNLYFACIGDIETGSFMIIIGLLLHYWRKNYFSFFMQNLVK